MRKKNFKKAYLLIGFFSLLSSTLSAQNKAYYDSLQIVYEAGDFNEKRKLYLLNKLSFATNSDTKLKFSIELIEFATKLNSTKHILRGYLNKGNAYKEKGEFTKAIESYFEGASFANKSQIPPAQEYTSIADVYKNMGNIPNAKIYYTKALDIFKVSKDSTGLATVLVNAGDMYFNLGELDTALIYTREGATLFQQLGHRLGHAYSLGNMGMIFAAKGKDLEAENNMNQANTILEEMDEFYPICVYLNYISDIYHKNGNAPKALNYANKSLTIAKTYQLKQQIRDGHIQLSKLHESNDNTEQSLFHYKAHINYRDSINNLDAVQKMADLRTDFEVSQKQVEVDLLKEEEKNQRLIRIGLTAILGLISALLFSVYRNARIVAKEKKRSDNLLLNILPVETAEELKTNGKVQARRFDNVSVLFTDFVGFTSYSKDLSPEVLVECIDYYFTEFDKIMEQYGLEKIKTIGDSYMCASGLPFPTPDHAKNITLAAIEIINFFKNERINNPAKDLPFEVRIGINSGPVVAGVVGFKKFAYDIWGDTVNTASRLETNSALGRINISEATYLLIKEDFDCEYRGTFEVKNKGMMKMYFVNGEKYENRE